MQSGRGTGEDPWGPHRAEFHVELKPNVSGRIQADAQEQIRERLARYPGITYEVLTFLGDRISETISGETASVVINLYANDLDALDDSAKVVALALSTVAGATDIGVASPPGAPELRIQLRADRLAQYGFKPVDVLAAVQTAYQGTRVAQTYQENQVTDAVVILPPELRRDPESIGSLRLRNEKGYLS
jgi:Cu/Ag efflux pump CusA